MACPDQTVVSHAYYFISYRVDLNILGALDLQLATR